MCMKKAPVNLLAEQQRAIGQRLVGLELLEVQDHVLVVVGSRIKAGEESHPASSVGGKAVGQHVAQPLEDRGGDNVFLQGGVGEPCVALSRPRARETQRAWHR